MKIKILDRHILIQFVIPVLYCFLAFNMLFVVFDLFDNLSCFLEARTPPWLVARYYLCIIPALSVYIAPISLLLGLLYGLWQMTRHNELTAMRASGVSLLRIAMPLLCAGVIVSLTISALQEWVAPDSGYWAAQFIKRQQHDEDISQRFALDLPYKNERHNRIWAIRRFDLETYEMRDVELRQQRADGTDVETIRAAEARFYDNRWWFFDVVLQRYDLDNNPMGQIERLPLMEMHDLTETPRNFANEVKDPIFFSSFELHDFLRTHRNLSDKTRSLLLVDLHARLAMPWTCLIVILFGIPFGIHTARQGAFMGVILALITFFVFYLIMMLGQWLGKQEYMAPLLGAWLPNVLFLAIGLGLMWRVR